MTTLEPDRDQLEIFVNAIFRHAKEGFISLRAFFEGNDKTFRISTVRGLSVEADLGGQVHRNHPPLSRDRLTIPAVSRGK